MMILKKANFYTGLTGLAHLRRVLFGKNYIAAEHRDTDRVTIYPDMPNEAAWKLDGDSWVRVRAFDEKDAETNARAAYDQAVPVEV